jgi:hypothetical protein
MSAIIVPFETRAQREERLHRELMATYRAYARADAPVRWDAFMQALDRLVAFQMRHSPQTCPTPRRRAVYVCLITLIVHRAPAVVSLTWT